VLLQISWTPLSLFPNTKWNKLHIHARICTSCSEHEANVYADVYNICLTCPPAHAWCSTTPVNACMLSAKMHMDSCMCAYATVQKFLFHESYCELTLSVARASCRLSCSARPSTGSTKSVARRRSLKKSVQIHARTWRGRRCGVAKASSNHPHWCRPHPVCLQVALARGHGVYPSQKCIFAIFRASWSKVNLITSVRHKFLRA